MKRITFLTAILMASTMAFAEDTTTTETCANGAGTVITGAVSGRKYCMSNNSMDWWNAMAWCDGLGRRLFSLGDCAFSSTSATGCNDLNGVGGKWGWTATPKETTHAYIVYLSSGSIGTGFRWYVNGYDFYALCY